MREILFRGKRLDNGEWTEGFYTASPAGNHYITRIGAMGCAHPDKVDPDTVGQYTGLKDKNGRPIFEGDILQIAGYGEVIDRCVIGYGIFNPYCYSNKMVGFYLYWKGDKSNKYANLPYWVEIRQAVCVGNIHDDPELINRGI